LTDEFHYRGFAIKATPLASPGGGWTQQGRVQHDLHPAVDHMFSAPGKSGTRDDAVRVILGHGKQIIDSWLAGRDTNATWWRKTE
jgi:hypothetical protein